MEKQEQNEIWRQLGNGIDLERITFPFIELSPRHNEILRLVLEGNTISEIASQLSLDERTVLTYHAKLVAGVKSNLVNGKSIKDDAPQSPPATRTSRPERLPRPPINAEYILYLLLRKEEREVVIGDLLECYGQMVRRFDKRRADIWFYKQVGGSLLPLLRRALLKIGALVWLGRILRRLIS
jgi:hypothetical protein